MACAGASSDEEIEVMEEIELSSDEDNVDDDEEVSLIILKRPPAVVRTVQDVEVCCIYLTSFMRNFIIRLLSLVLEKQREVRSLLKNTGGM